MASSSCPVSHFDAVCCVCQESYQTPKILPCGHTYCSRCLIRHIESRLGEKTVQCPKCHQPIKCPGEFIEIWVNQLKTDERIANLQLAKTERQRGYLKKFIPGLQNHEVSCLAMKGVGIFYDNGYSVIEYCDSLWVTLNAVT